MLRQIKLMDNNPINWIIILNLSFFEHKAGGSVKHISPDTKQSCKQPVITMTLHFKFTCSPYTQKEPSRGSQLTTTY